MILNTQEFACQLKQSIENANEICVIASAFIKKKALLYLMKDFQVDKCSVCIIARWQKHDLLAGASDMEVYELCKNIGWRFGIAQELHGKIYLIDESEVYLGSSNLTQKGLGLIENSNFEFGTKFYANDVDINKVNSFMSQEVIWMDDELYGRIKKETEVSRIEKEPIGESSWSTDLLTILGKPIEFLWVQELPFKAPNDLICLDLNDNNSFHDFNLLGLNIDECNKSSLKRKFKMSRSYGWLKYVLDKNESVNFGGLSNELHNALLDDPLPYRKNVKEFVAVLFSWMSFLSDDFVITKHRNTSSVRLKV